MISMKNSSRFMDTKSLVTLQLLEIVTLFKVNTLISGDHSVSHQKILLANPPLASRQSSPYVIKSGYLEMSLAIGASKEYFLHEDETL